MQLKFGDYSFEVNGVQISADVEAVLNEARRPVAQIYTYGVTGFLLGSGQSDLTLKENALRAALKKSYVDLKFYQDSGSVSSISLPESTTLSGVVVTRGPSFPGRQGNEFATQREFSFEVQSQVQLPNTNTELLDFEETLSFSGGGPFYTMKRSVTGPPQRQLVWANTEYVCVQQGRSIGYRRYPIFPGPIWPFALKESPRVSRVSPKRTGKKYQRYVVTWEYVYESVTPLVGVPNIWR